MSDENRHFLLSLLSVPFDTLIWNSMLTFRFAKVKICCKKEKNNTKKKWNTHHQQASFVEIKTIWALSKVLTVLIWINQTFRLVTVQVPLFGLSRSIHLHLLNYWFHASQFSWVWFLRIRRNYSWLKQNIEIFVHDFF